MAYFTKLVKRSYSNIPPIILSDKYKPSICKKILENHTISVLGYGSQGRSQSLNLRDSNNNVILGLRPNGKSWEYALHDGWEPNKNLFDIDEACHKGTIIKYLISDEAQIKQWDNIKYFLYPNNTLYFSHGFGIHYKHYTNIKPTKDVNIIMVSPKCSGKTIRDNFLNNKGFTSSFVIQNDYNNAYDICMALAFSIGNNYIFETSFEKEILNDLTGERSILMGMIQNAFFSQYKVFRNNGLNPNQAYSKTIEESIDSIYPIIDKNCIDWLYKNSHKNSHESIQWDDVFQPKLKYDFKESFYSYSIKEEKEISSLEIWQIKQELKKLKSQNKWNGFLL